MFGIRTNKLTNSSTTESSSDDEIALKDSYCVVVEEIDKCSIYSNKSDDNSIVKYSQGSFSFHTVGTCVILQLNKMFVWRVIHKTYMSTSKELETDIIKIRVFVSMYMSKPEDIIICVYPDKISYPNPRDGKIKSVETTRYCLSILDAFNQLYTDIVRKYNTNERVDEMIKKCADILCFITHISRDS
jgi:hypothetical protein